MELRRSTDASWYALLLKPRAERRAEELLSAQGFEVFLPTHAVQIRRGGRTIKLRKPLFPTYLFARFDWADRLQVITSPGIKNVVSFSGAPVLVSLDEIERLRRIVDSGRPVSPYDYLEAGTLVRIASGPLQGLEGRLVENKSVRQLVVNIDILHRAVSVVIDRADVVPAARAHHA